MKSSFSHGKNTFFILLIIICIFQYAIQKICSFTLVPDEFGYWASAAKAVGYDWSEVASMGSYYSFGYSLILVPVLFVFRGGVMAYRAAVFINALLMCAGVFALKGITDRLFCNTDPVRASLYSGIAVLYPVWIFYMQMTMTEALLNFLFLWIVYLMLVFVEKPKMTMAGLLALSLIYIYSVHMRSAGVVIACLIILTVYGLYDRNSRKAVLYFLLLAVAFFLLAVMIKSRIRSTVFAYASPDRLNGNDYGSQSDKIRDILTVNGMKDFLTEVLGKVYYLGMASFGTFYFAAGWCISQVATACRRISDKQRLEVKHWIAAFLLLAGMGEILIASIYMHGSKQLDTLVYGRYDEFLLPVFILIGLAAMEKNRHPFVITTVIGTVSGIVTVILLNFMEKKGMTGLRGYHMAGMSYLLKEENLSNIIFFRNTWILLFALMLLVTGVVCLSKRGKAGVYLLSLILMMEIAAGLQISEQYTYRANRGNYEDMIISDTLEEKLQEKETVLYLDNGSPEYIDAVQLQLPQTPVHVMEEEKWKEALLQADFLIVSSKSELEDQLDKMYEEKVTGNSFYLYYGSKLPKS